MSTRYHVHLDIKGALMNWRPEQFEGMFTHPGGKPMTAWEVEGVLLDELAKGHEKIPCDDCDNFDFKKGCMGHRVEPGGGDKRDNDLSQETAVSSLT